MLNKLFHQWLINLNLKFVWEVNEISGFVKNSGESDLRFSSNNFDLPDIVMLHGYNILCSIIVAAHADSLDDDDKNLNIQQNKWSKLGPIS